MKGGHMDCEGCMFERIHAKRCNICSRKYLDRYEPIPPPKPMSKKAAMALSTLFTIAAMTKIDGNPYMNIDE
jgi:hypothetical protein